MLPVVQSRAELMKLDVKIGKDVLLNTIRVPKNLLVLSDKLPKPNYEMRGSLAGIGNVDKPNVHIKKEVTLDANKGRLYLREQRSLTLKQLKRMIIAKKQVFKGNKEDTGLIHKSNIELPKEVSDSKEELYRNINKQKYLSKRIKESQSIESISYNTPYISDPFIQQIVNKRNPIIKSSSHKIKLIDNPYAQKLSIPSNIHRHKVSFIDID
jgi:hypothetical protein